MHKITPHHTTTSYIKISALVLVIALGLVSAIYISLHHDSIFSARSAAGQHTDLLASGWDHMPGVTPQPNGLGISFTDRTIVQQDGTVGMIRPAVNLYGTHTYADGDYEITAKLSGIKGGAVLRFYSAAPLTQDEFYTNPNNLELIVRDTSITINNWANNQSKNPYTQKPTSSLVRTIDKSSAHTLSFRHNKDQLMIQVDGSLITTQSQYRSNLGKELWFGLSTLSPTDSWTLQSLGMTTTTPNRVFVVNTETMPPVQRSSTADALQTLAARKRTDFQIGAAVALAPSVSDTNYRNIVYGGQFGSITTENALKWQFIHPEMSAYDFTDADNLVNLARQHALSVHGHTLVFGEANPAWVQALPTTTAADKLSVKQVMVDHITKTVGHFKGRISSWDVVNEPLSDDDDTVGLRPHKWFDAMGESYIVTAFQTAHQTDPQAKLFINDYGLEADGDRWDAMLALVTKLKTAGVPIDGVGLQAHVYEEADLIDPNVLRQHVKQLAAIGLTARISEMDVYGYDGPDIQTEQYRDVLATCMAESNCVSWTTWGVTDRYNLYLDDRNRITTGQDYLWNEDGKPTAAVSAMQQFLQQ